MARSLKDSQGYNEQEIVIERPDGGRRIALAHANPIHDESGRVVGAVNILVDITERRRAEDELRRHAEALQEADRRKTEFLAMLAHELRNPLAPIRNSLQILRVGNHDGAAVAKARAVMDRQLGHMVRLIDDLLDLSRITKGKIELRRERIALASAVQDAVEVSRPLLEERCHEFSLRLPHQPVYVDADRTRLAQVFANLLNNAAKYTDKGGHVSLTVERHGSDAVVTVKDDGAGMPANLLPRVFDVFTQGDRSLERSQGGLGIGLSLVRGLVEMHGGRVEARSDGPGKGSEFIVRLPVLLSPVGDSRDGEAAAGRAGGCSPQRILVVDDNQDAALSLSLMLNLLGHDTQTAHDGPAAVALAETFRPDVVLLDIGLPGLNGYDTCRRLRGQPWGARMVLIAVTGWGQEEDKRRSQEAGFNFHMVKPVDPAALEKLLDGILLTPA
jgi:signal transduction histidine kinase